MTSCCLTGSGAFTTTFVGPPTPVIDNPWRTIHRYAAAQVVNSTFDSADAQTFFEAWLATIPAGDCLTNFNALLAINPPDYSSGEAFERWLYDRHDDVTRMHTGRTRLTFSQAQRVWRGPRYGIFTPILGMTDVHASLYNSLRVDMDIVGIYADTIHGDIGQLEIPIYQSKTDLESKIDQSVSNMGITVPSGQIRSSGLFGQLFALARPSAIYDPVLTLPEE